MKLLLHIWIKMDDLTAII